MMVGFFNYVPHWRVAAILMPGRTASKRLRDRAEAEGRLLDARHGRRTRSLVVTDANQVILSAVAPETLRERLEKARQAAEGLRTTGGTPAPGWIACAANYSGAAGNCTRCLYWRYCNNGKSCVWSKKP